MFTMFIIHLLLTYSLWRNYAQKISCWLIFLWLICFTQFNKKKSKPKKIANQTLFILHFAAIWHLPLMGGPPRREALQPREGAGTETQTSPHWPGKTPHEQSPPGPPGQRGPCHKAPRWQMSTTLRVQGPHQETLEHRYISTYMTKKSMKGVKCTKVKRNCLRVLKH